ncbi:MAG: competence/damage-inducible protein A [Candidatus Fonsibacter ubiquis]|nr:competence/damage-inducible protein A [Candidatus Fonsibacter ubiquis]
MSMRNEKRRFFAAILIIGDEILSGRTQDANTCFLAKWLNERGIQLKEVRIIPDQLRTIINNVNILRKKYDYVFTTGGIGPTHDDITALAISKVFKKRYEYNKEALKILETHYKNSYLNDLQSMMHSIEQLIKGGQKVFSETVTGKMPESKIGEQFGKLQKKFKDLSLGSYPFFQAGKIGVALVIRGYSKKRILQCKKVLQNLVNKIEKS